MAIIGTAAIIAIIIGTSAGDETAIVAVGATDSTIGERSSTVH